MIFKLGTRGEDVKNLQQALKTLGFPIGKVDGIFGNKTKEAVIAFQITSKLNADGVVGPITWEKLFPR
jgi:g-D-glutamyl-meso-diaminopimelate peptidase